MVTDRKGDCPDEAPSPTESRVAPRTKLPRLTDRRPLGPTGLAVSPFCLGMVDDGATICAAFDAGINFFFLTADMHWPLYRQARRGLAALLSRGGGIRDRIVVAATAYTTQPEFCTFNFKELLDEMPELDRIDVLVSGGAYSADVLTRLRVFEANRSRRHCGASAIGVSFHDRGAAAQVAGHDLCDLAFVRFNAAHGGARRELFPTLAAREHRSLIYNFKSTSGYVKHERFEQLGLGSHHWKPDVTDHYRFALTRPELDGILCSFLGPWQVEAAARALEKGPLDEEEVQYLIDLHKLSAGLAQLAPEEDRPGGEGRTPGRVLPAGGVAQDGVQRHVVPERTGAGAV